MEERKVDKTGCINFAGQHYEVGMDLIGRKVDVRYDPQWLGEVEIHHKDKPSFKVKQLVIGENCGCHTELPEGMMPRETTTSRLLDGLNKANITNRTKKKVAVLYGNKNSSEGELNV